MVFNSFEFFVFFLVVLAFYFAFAAYFRVQNFLLLMASYVFYGWWDWRFLGLIWLSTVIDYFCALKLDQASSSSRKKLFLGISVVSNLGILGFFKYFNFFVDSLIRLGGVFGTAVDFPLLHIILPVGISFYTFQTMSYTLDVYRGKLQPTRRFFDFALFVAFFPQLVAGPIERASHLLPQVMRKRTYSWEHAMEGSYLIGWGLFKKVFIADNLAVLVERVFSSQPDLQGAAVLIGLYAFAFQIYCDFSGYSDIARGIGKILGFDIMWNFRLPYFSATPAEFWQRWHISLSTWLKDYLYIPLGGNRHGALKTVRNLFVTMLLGGLWHGAQWTFVFWGFYHGLLLVIYRMIEPFSHRIAQSLQPIPRFIGRIVAVLVFFHLVCLGWLFFRAESMTHAGTLLNALFFHFGEVDSEKVQLARLLFYCGILLVVQLFQYLKDDLMAVLRMPVWVRTVFYVVCYFLFTLYGASGGKEFIYFQF